MLYCTVAEYEIDSLSVNREAYDRSMIDYLSDRPSSARRHQFVWSVRSLARPAARSRLSLVHVQLVHNGFFSQCCSVTMNK